MPGLTKEQSTQAETEEEDKKQSRAEPKPKANGTHLQRQRPAAPAHPAPGEGSLVVVHGVGARRVAAVVVRAAAVPVAVAGGRVEAAEQEVGQRRRQRHGDLCGSSLRRAAPLCRFTARRTQPVALGGLWLPRRAVHACLREAGKDKCPGFLCLL